MRPARLNYFRESLETSLGRMDFSPEEVGIIVSDAASCLHEDMDIPPDIFNIGKVFQFLAEGNSPVEDVRAALIKNPKIIFNACNVDTSVPERDADPKIFKIREQRSITVPTDEQIVQFAMAAKKILGRWPQIKDSKVGIEAGYVGWGKIVRSLTERGTSIAILVNKAHPEIKISDDGKFIPTRPTLERTIALHSAKREARPV